MKKVENQFRTFIDCDGSSCKYMIVPIYKDNGYHINIMGVKTLENAFYFASIIAHDLDIVCYSVNEGYYASC